MKTKRTILISSIICVSLLLGISVSALLSQREPLLRLEGAYDAVNLRIVDAEIRENTITLHVNYDSYGPYVEIISPMLVAADSDFTQPLNFMGSTWSADENQFVYTFEFDEQSDRFNGQSANSIYVRPPVIHVPVEFEAISVPVALNAAMPMVLGVSDGARVNEPWFSISSIEVREDEEYEFFVSVMIDPYTSDFPRLPRLEIGGISHDVLVTHHSFNENVEFMWAIFEFPVQADDADEIYAMLETAYITVDLAMIRTYAVNAIARFSSKAASLNGININFVVD